MYIPEDFRVTDPATIRQFVEEHPYGMMIVNGHNGFPVVVHLPFLVKFRDDAILLEGHVAKANEINNYLTDGRLAKIVLNGAHGYISSSVYGHKNVPTYNYQTAHLYGTIDLFSSEELINHLGETVTRYESTRTKPLQMKDFPTEMLNDYLKEISGFRLTVFKTEVAFKLSQNRNEFDFEQIVNDLVKGTNDQQRLAEVMLNWRSKKI